VRVGLARVHLARRPDRTPRRRRPRPAAWRRRPAAHPLIGRCHGTRHSRHDRRRARSHDRTRRASAYHSTQRGSPPAALTARTALRRDSSILWCWTQRATAALTRFGGSSGAPRPRCAWRCAEAARSSSSNGYAERSPRATRPSIRPATAGSTRSLSTRLATDTSTLCAHCPAHERTRRPLRCPRTGCRVITHSEQPANRSAGTYEVGDEAHSHIRKAQTNALKTANSIGDRIDRSSVHARGERMRNAVHPTGTNWLLYKC
jgi:hypothetical protein